MGERGFRGNPLLMGGESYSGGCGCESGPADKPAPVAISSWRPWQVEGKLVATVQPDATSAGAWLVGVTVFPRSCW